MSNYWKNWIKAAGVRAVKTVAQTARGHNRDICRDGRCELGNGCECISIGGYPVTAYKHRRYPGSEGR